MYFDKPLFLVKLGGLIEKFPNNQETQINTLVERLKNSDIMTQTSVAELIEEVYRTNKFVRRAKSYSKVKFIFKTLADENRQRLHALPKKSKLVYQCVVGSQAFKTNTETSDYDIKGVYIQNTIDFSKMDGYIPSVTIGKDEIYYELNRFLELLLEGEAMALEMLFSPKRCIMVESPEIKYLKKYKDKFIAKKLYYTFYNYAIGQFKKATNYNKMANWDENDTKRQPITNFCRICDRVTGNNYLFTEYLKIKGINPEDITLTKLDGMHGNFKVYHYKSRGWYKENSNEVRTGAIPKEINNDWLGVLSFNHSEYSKHCKRYAKYQKWLVDRSEERYNTNKAHGQKYDAKNVMHTVRLIMTSLDILKHRTIIIERESEREYLLNIKHGNVPLKDVLDYWFEKTINIEEDFMNSDLPMSADKLFFKKILDNIRLYQKVPKKQVLLEYV